MARPTFSVRGLVLRRTKLGESDVIVTLLSQDGSQIRAIAKGARKPTSSFASRLELFCVCDLLLVSGKSLDIVKEARLVEGNEHLRADVGLVEAASPMVELLDKTTQDGLVEPRLFPMVCAALESLSDLPQDDAPSKDVTPPRGVVRPMVSDRAVLLCAAELLKTSGVLGFRPRFDLCVGCGESLSLVGDESAVPFSLVDGGLVCSQCQGGHETVLISGAVAAWSQAILFSTFDEIRSFKVPHETLVGIVRFLQMWIRHHLGIKLVSLDFLISSFA